jgi:putative FmdB family regulatory protein
MPLYEYNCPKCHKDFELLRELAERDEECECPHCKETGKMPRKSSLISSLGSLSPQGSGGSCAPSGSSYG